MLFRLEPFVGALYGRRVWIDTRHRP